jgi:hypothetical protein
MCKADTGLINDGDVLELRQWVIRDISRGLSLT